MNEMVRLGLIISQLTWLIFYNQDFFFGGGAQNKVTLQLGLNFDPVQAGENSIDLPKLDQALSHRTFSSWNQNFGQKTIDVFSQTFDKVKPTQSSRKASGSSKTDDVTGAEPHFDVSLC